MITNGSCIKSLIGRQLVSLISLSSYYSAGHWGSLGASPSAVSGLESLHRHYNGWPAVPPQVHRPACAEPRYYATTLLPASETTHEGSPLHRDHSTSSVGVWLSLPDFRPNQLWAAQRHKIHWQMTRTSLLAWLSRIY